MTKAILLLTLTICGLTANAFAASEEIVLRNVNDLKCEKMLPDLGEDSPRFSILRID